MKKIITFLLVCLITVITQAQSQWANFPGTALEISCGSSQELACIAQVPSSTSKVIKKYNFATSTWSDFSSNGNWTGVSIGSDASMWIRSSTTLATNSNLAKYLNMPAISNSYSNILGLLDNISVGSNSSAIGSVGSSLNNIYRTTTTANTFSVLPNSTTFSAKKVVMGSNGDIAALNYTNFTNNIYRYTPGVGWAPLVTPTVINATDLAIGNNYTFQMLAVSGGNLYILYNGDWMLDQTAPANVTKATVAANGKVYILTNEPTNNIYTATYDNLICANNATPPSSNTPTAALTVCGGTTTTLSVNNTSGIFYWYDTPTAGTPLAVSSSSFTTPPITQTKTFYVSVFNSPCHSPRTPITVNVVPGTSAGTLSGFQTFCATQETQFSSTVAGGVWSTSNPSLLSINATGYANGTGAGPGAVNVIYTVAGSGGCPAASSTLAVTLTSAPPNPVNTTPAANLAICNGNSTILSVASPSQGVPFWSYLTPTPVALNTGTTSTVSPSSNLTFRVWNVDISNNCSSPDSIEMTVTVSPTPSAPAITGGASQSVCSGNSKTLTATGSGTLQWFTSATGGTAIATGSTFTTPVLTNTTSYYVQSSLNGCVSTRTLVTVTANAIPVVPIDQTPASQLAKCQGSSSLLTATSGQVNAQTRWYTAATGGTSIATGIQYTTPALNATTTYYASSYFTTGCESARIPITVTITVPLSNGAVSGPQTLCLGAVATYTTNASGGFWSSTNPIILANTPASGVTTAVGVGTASVNYSAPAVGGCPAVMYSQSVTVSPAPSAGTLSGNQNICLPGTSTFTSTVSGGTWSSSSNAIATVNATTGVVTGVAAGTATITYTVTGSGSCNATVTRTVQVFSTITAGTLSGIQAICSDAPTTFSSTVSGGTWSSANPTIATVDASTGLVTGVGAGIATITYTVPGSGSCPGASATRTVTVTVAPNAGIVSGAQSICLPGTTTFSTTGSGGTWSSSNNAIATVNASGVVSGVSVGTATITYTVTGTGGCANATATRTVTVENATTPALISGDNSICLGVLGSNLTLSSSSTSGTWSSANNGIATVNQNGAVSGVAAGNVNIIYTIPANGTCAAVSSSYPITVNTPSPTTTINETICFGETFILNGLPYPNQGTFGQNLPNSNGCDSLITLNLTILPEYTFSSAVQLCVGENYDFFGTILNTGGNYSELLVAASGCDSVVNLNLSFVSQINTTKNASICSGENYSFGTQNLSATGVYTETFASAGGCDSIVTLNLNVLSLPTALVVTQNGAILSANSGFDTYAWYSSANPGTILGTSASFTATTSGSYYVEVEAANGCTEKSAEYDVVLSGIENLWNAAFSLAPNPARNLVTIENLTLGCTIKLSAITGQTLFETNVENESVTIDLAQIAEGLYLVCLYENGVLRGTKKLVVTK